MKQLNLIALIVLLGAALLYFLDPGGVDPAATGPTAPAVSDLSLDESGSEASNEKQAPDSTRRSVAGESHAPSAEPRPVTQGTLPIEVV